MTSQVSEVRYNQRFMQSVLKDHMPLQMKMQTADYVMMPAVVIRVAQCTCLQLSAGELPTRAVVVYWKKPDICYSTVFQWGPITL